MTDIKRAIAALIVGSIVFGVACSSGSKSAEDKYEAFVKKYEPAFKDLQNSTGSKTDSFDKYVADEGCEPLGDEYAGVATMVVGPALAKHGLSVSDFLKDQREVQEAIKAEGLCNSVKTSATTATTVKAIGPGSATCAEAKAKTNEYMDSAKGNPLSFDKATFDRLFGYQNEVCRP